MSFWRRRISNHWRRHRGRRDAPVTTLLVDVLVGQPGWAASANEAT